MAGRTDVERALLARGAVVMTLLSIVNLVIVVGAEITDICTNKIVL
jgi:hypothetical protein